MPATVRVTWYESVAARYGVWGPQQAHATASQIAAGAAAQAIHSTYSGDLARDVSAAKPISPLYSKVGSDKPYARIEHFGGEIRPRRYPRLYIRGRRIGSAGQATRSTFRGPIVATAESVFHRGKRYLDQATAAYVPAVITALRQVL